MISRSIHVLATALVVVIASSEARSQATIDTPAASGDQLVFFYDARSGRVPFLTVSNPSDAAVEVEVAFYPADLGSRLGAQTYTLAPAGNVVIDPTAASVAQGAVSGNLGLAVVTPVTPGTTQAIVPPEPLTGGFTLANSTLAAAFGENALGRLAVSGSGNRAAPGAAVNGSAVRYQRFAPEVLVVPVHFNPQTLAPPSQDGNRVVLVAFTDQYGARFDVAAASDAAPVVFFDANGFEVGAGTATIDGVLSTDLQALAGSSTLSRSGKAFIDVSPGNGNAFGIFSQSLGTFASGQRMPGVALVPEGLGPAPSSTPTPSPTPGPTGGGGTSASCAGTVTLTARIAYADGAMLSGTTLDIMYPNTVSIPGFGPDQSVVDRVTNLTGATGIFQVGDTDTSINVGLVSLPATTPAGPFASVRFDCSGGSVSTSSFSCIAVGSDNNGNDVPVSCALTIAAP